MKTSLNVRSVFTSDPPIPNAMQSSAVTLSTSLKLASTWRRSLSSATRLQLCFMRMPSGTRVPSSPPQAPSSTSLERRPAARPRTSALSTRRPAKMTSGGAALISRWTNVRQSDYLSALARE
jgi:hypothetical protein